MHERLECVLRFFGKHSFVLRKLIDLCVVIQYFQIRNTYVMKVKHFRKAVTMLVICIMLTVYYTAHAQKLFFLFGHALYASPLEKEFKDTYKYGIGAEGGAGIGWKKTFITGTIGYTSFTAETSNVAGKVNSIPIKIGLRHYLLEKLLYVHGDIGIASIKDEIMSSAQTKFSGDIGTGLKIGGLEVQLDFDGFSRANPSGYNSWIALKAGFAIGL